MTATTAATTPIAIPTFAPVLNPLLSLLASTPSEGDVVDVAVGSNVEEATAEVEVRVSWGDVTVMTVYDADVVEGVTPPPTVLVAAADGAEVWLHSALPLESV